MDTIKELAAELLYVCYRSRRLHGATAWSLADEFGGVVVLEIRFQVEQAGLAALKREQEQARSNEFAQERE